MARDGLAITGQTDFSAGMFPIAARDRIPVNGAYELENCLLDDAGLAPRRGGTEYLTTAAFGAGLTFLWDGELGGAHRTLVASETAFGKLATPGTVVTSLGGAGLHFPVRPAAVKDKLYLPGGVTFDGTALGTASKIADVYIAAGGRLIACIGNQAFMSASGDPTLFGVDDFHRLPDGVKILGGQGTRDRAALFTTGGIWLISNVELDLVDDFGNVQQRLDVFSRDLVLWGDAGVAGWEGGMVVPTLDGIWVVSVGGDEVSAPPPFRRLSTPIADLYAEYVRVGFRPGGATVHRGHYFLPILNGPSVVDLLVCRLDRGAWSRITGHGGNLSALTTRVSATAQPILLGAQRDATARVTRLRYLEPGAPKSDANGTTGRWTIVTRDLRAGSQQVKSFQHRLRIEYLLEDAAADNPTISAEYALEEPQTTAGGPVWGGSTWNGTTWAATDEAYVALTGSAPEDPTASKPFSWLINKRAERIRCRLRCTGPSARLSLRSLSLFTRPTGKI